jgi:hypothetical protein
MPVLTLDQIESLCFDALKRAGASDEQAAIVAEEIMDAEAEGIRNVGLGYLHLYLKHLRCGKINPRRGTKNREDLGVDHRGQCGFWLLSPRVCDRRGTAYRNSPRPRRWAHVDSSVFISGRTGAGLCDALHARGWCR